MKKVAVREENEEEENVSGCYASLASKKALWLKCHRNGLMWRLSALSAGESPLAKAVLSISIKHAEEV